MSVAFKVPIVSVIDAGRVVGNGRGLDGARDDALARRVRLLEVRAGRPLREAELAEVEAWAAGLVPEEQLAAPTPATAAASPAQVVPAPAEVRSLAAALPARSFDGQGQVLLFPRTAPFGGSIEASNPRPRRACAKCRAELAIYPGRGAPRRFCLACRPRAAKVVALDGAARPARPARRRRTGATGGQTLLWPALAGACQACGGCLAPYAGVGRPRRWCARCRPARPHRPARSPRVGDRVRVAGDELQVVARRRLQIEGRRWQGAVEVRRPNGLLVVIPLVDWRATSVEVLLVPEA